MKNKSNTAAVISYITWVGFFVALIVGDRSDSFTRHHLNQALILNIISIVGGYLTIVPLLGAIASRLVSLAVFIFWCMGIYRAATWSTEPLPLIGDIHII